MAEYVQMYAPSDGPFFLCHTVASMVKEECGSNLGRSF